MGFSPSVHRAWIAIIIHLIGLYNEYRPIAINTLGIAFILSVVFDPLILYSVGFQLSFCATFGIIAFYKEFEHLLEIISPKKPFIEILGLSSFEKIIYILCAFFRSSIALQCSVLLCTLPLIFFHFETFPLISVVYNLFIPIFFAVLVFSMLLKLNFITKIVAKFILMVVEHPPKKIIFHINSNQAWVCLLASTAFFLLLKAYKRHGIRVIKSTKYALRRKIRTNNTQY